VPLVVGFVLLFLPRGLRSISKAATLIVSLIAFCQAVRIFRLDEASYAWSILAIGNFRLDLLLSAQPLGSFILIFATGFGVLIALYSLASKAQISRINEYYGSILLAIGGSAGILLSDHLLFLLIFWEIVTASLYILISTGGKSSNFAATKSFAMIGASDAGFLLGIGMVWVLAGTFVISEVNLATTAPLPIVAFLLLMVAAITKAGAMPLHTWLPTSGEYAPTSVMALLPAALDKLLGIYLLIVITRRMFVLEPGGALGLVLAIIGVATIVIAVMIAMVQHNLKRLLSYHAVSQVGYMILGIATLTPVGIAGGIFHMLNNAIYKCCLFLCGGAVEEATGTAELEELGGLGRRMPLTFLACMIAALSISGVPPLNGFASKWMVYHGVVEMGRTQTGAAAAMWPLWLVGAMFGSALTLASFVKILHSIFLSRLPDRLQSTQEVSVVQVFPMLVLASLCVFFGVFYQVPLQRFILPGIGEEGTGVSVGSWNAVLATALLLIGVGAGLGVLALSAFAKKTRIVPTWTCGEIQPNDEMIIPGTHFYKTVSSMGGLKQMYAGQERGYFDTYDHGGKVGFVVTGLLRWLHSGILPAYLTWVTLGLLLVLFAICRIW